MAALLAAAEVAEWIGREVQARLDRGQVVLADRYAWTGVARDVARGLDARWAADLYRFAPVPDLVVYRRQDPVAALAAGLRLRPAGAGSDAATEAYEAFLRDLVAAFDVLASEPGRGPWPTETLLLNAGLTGDARDRAIRAALEPRLDGVTAAPVSGGTTTTRPATGDTAHGEPGILLAVEGIDRSGRSTHVRRLEAHLRYAGRGVARTSLASSSLSGEPIRVVKHGRHPDPVELALLYAADLAERVEQVVQPSLRAGLVVIADRYRWTPMARAEARGVDGDWLERLFSFAPRPDAVLFLDIDADASLARHPDDPDPYEAGLELGLAPDRRESYRLFQDRLIRRFERYAERDGFTRIPAAGTVERVGDLVLRAADAVVVSRARADRALQNRRAVVAP